MGINSMQMLTQMMGGLDTNSIIQQLDFINRQSIYQPNGLGDQLSKVQAQQSDWRNVNNSVLTLQNMLLTLTSKTTFGSFTTTSSDSTIVTGTAGTSATPGTYNVNVTGIGSNATLASGGRLGNYIAGTDLITATKFSAGITAGNFAVIKNGVTQYVAVASTDTIQGVLDKIATAFGNTVSGTVNANGQIALTTTDNQRITFGSSGDTSNFAHVLGLDIASETGAGPYTYTTQSQGQVQLGQTLGSANANFAVGLTSTTTGDFKINNVDITYDTTKDNLSTVINRINTSSSGVTASYDPINDKVVLTSKSSQAITAQDVTGNLMQTLKLDSASGNTTAGSNWTYSINGTTMSSVASAVTSAIPGVTLNLLKTGQATVTIASDTSAAVKAVQDFVAQFNSLYGMIGNLTGKGGDLQGDSTLTGFRSNLMTAVTSQITTIGWDASNNPIPLPAYPQQSLMGIGISTGAAGSAIGTTNSLQVDTTKLTNALQQNPAMVRDLITGMTVQLNQNLTSMTGMVNILSNPAINVTTLTGMSTSQDNLFNTMINDINDQIQSVNDMADQQKKLLITQFTAMNSVISQTRLQGSALSGFASGGML